MGTQTNFVSSKPSQPKWLTYKELAKRLKVNKSTIKNWTKKNKWEKKYIKKQIVICQAKRFAVVNWNDVLEYLKKFNKKEIK